MSLDFNLYLRNKPDFASIIDIYNMTHSEKTFPDSKLVKWKPPGSKYSISIFYSLNGPTYPFTTIDKESLDEQIATAQFAGIEIPPEFLDKIVADDCLNNTDHGIIELPPDGAPKNYTGDTYTIIADEQMHSIGKRYPQLEGLEIGIREPMGLARLLGGSKVYEVDLEVPFFADEKGLEGAKRLLLYITKMYDGCAFNMQTSSFKEPNTAKLQGHQTGMTQELPRIVDEINALNQPTDKKS